MNSTTIKSYDEKDLSYRAKGIISYLLDMEKERKATEDKLRTSATQSFKIAEFLPYRWNTVKYKGRRRNIHAMCPENVEFYVTTFYSDITFVDDINKIDENEKADKEIHEKNKLIAAENLKSFEALKSLFVNIGLPLRCKNEKSRKTIKDYKDCDYLTEIRSYFKVTAPYFDSYQYASFKNAVLKQKAQKEQEEQTKLKEAEIQKKKKEMESFILSLVAKWGLSFPDGMPGIADVKLALRAKDQYLNLAAAMESVRNDWNDGCGEVEAVLFNPYNRFETAITNELNNICADFNDGRQFRDCTYNYTEIYKLANQELYADYMKLNTFES